MGDKEAGFFAKTASDDDAIKTGEEKQIVLVSMGWGEEGVESSRPKNKSNYFFVKQPGL